MASSTGPEVPGFLGTHRFSLTGKGTHQLSPKARKSNTGNPSIKIADKAPVTFKLFCQKFQKLLGKQSERGCPVY